MNKGKHEPTSSDQYIAWREKNCERCQRLDYGQRPPISCEWEYQFDLFTLFGDERPSDEIITAMFDKPLCRELIRNDLEQLINSKTKGE